MNRGLTRQNGMTLISFLLMFMVFGFFVLLTLKLAPIYLEHFKITSTLNALSKEPGLIDKTPAQISALIQKRWDINSVERITADKSLEFEKHGGSLKIRVIYEVEEPIMGNVSALVKFNDSITLGGSD